MSDAELFNNLISDSKIIKIVDLRNSTTIGKYLNGYKKQV